MTAPLDDVDAATAQAQHERGEVILLDVREPEEWQAGHAPGALHIPLGRLDADRLAGGEIVVLCRSGNRSAKAAALLASAGLPVHNLTGGMKAWAEHGLPIVTPQGGRGTVA